MAGGEHTVKVEAYGQSYDAFSSASLSRFLTLNVLIGAKPQALLMRDDRTTISAFRSFYPLPIDAFPHGMKFAMKWTRWPPYLAQKSPGSAREDKELWQRWNSTRGVECLGSDSVAVGCCGGAPSVGCSVDARTTLAKGE
jgi:hypothetical protein